MKLAGACSEAITRERMHVASAERAPVHEFDSEFERCLAAAHELALVETEERIESLEARNAGFADADGTDLIRLHDADARTGIRERLCQSGSRHPAGSSAAQDDDLFDGFTQAPPPLAIAACQRNYCILTYK